MRRMGVDLDGGFAEDASCGRAENLIRPRAAIDPRILAVLADAVGTPLHAIQRVAPRRSGPARNGRGCSGSAASSSSAIQLDLAFHGCPRDRDPARSERKRALSAKAIGADVVIEGSDDAVEPMCAAARRLRGRRR